MIRLAENLEALSMPCVSSPFGCQIRSKAQAYGFHQSFAQFWTDGEAAYGKTNGSVCIAGEIDLSHRMRHGTVRCAGVSADGKTVAMAAAVLGESASLISAVAVLPKFHRRGLGTAVVRKMERMLPSGTVYILREESKNEAFYDALGYKPCGAWAQGKLCN